MWDIHESLSISLTDNTIIYILFDCFCQRLQIWFTRRDKYSSRSLYLRLPHSANWIKWIHQYKIQCLPRIYNIHFLIKLHSKLECWIWCVMCILIIWERLWSVRACNEAPLRLILSISSPIIIMNAKSHLQSSIFGSSHQKPYNDKMMMVVSSLTLD